MNHDACNIQRILAHCEAIMTTSKYGGISFIKALIAHEFGYGGSTVRGPLATASVDKLSAADAVQLRELITFENSLK
jgi:4-hydroxy-2-oxoglutarate aldolase